jgi:hypothetical protein
VCNQSDYNYQVIDSAPLADVYALNNISTASVSQLSLYGHSYEFFDFAGCGHDQFDFIKDLSHQ